MFAANAGKHWDTTIRLRQDDGKRICVSLP